MPLPIELVTCRAYGSIRDRSPSVGADREPVLRAGLDAGDVGRPRPARAVAVARERRPIAGPVVERAGHEDGLCVRCPDPERRARVDGGSRPSRGGWPAPCRSCRDDSAAASSPRPRGVSNARPAVVSSRTPRLAEERSRRIRSTSRSWAPARRAASWRAASRRILTGRSSCSRPARPWTARRRRTQRMGGACRSSPTGGSSQSRTMPAPARGSGAAGSSAAPPG